MMKKEKVLIISLDGLRPDALTNCSVAQELMKKGSYTLNGSSVHPSITLPCHTSMFYSVDPDRHGLTDNIYMPQARPIDGLFEALKKSKKNCAAFYDWEQMRDVWRAGCTVYSYYCKGSCFGWDVTKKMIFQEAARYLNAYDTDLAYIYSGDTDETAHAHGWMSDAYLKAVDTSFLEIKNLLEQLKDDYEVMIVTDHGGHGRSHGSDMPEDMTVPMILLGDHFEAGKVLQNVNIKDVAPTAAKLLGVEAEPEWEGKALC